MNKRSLTLSILILVLISLPAPSFGQVVISFDRAAKGSVITDQYQSAHFSSDPGFVNVAAHDFSLGTSPANYLCTATDAGQLTCLNNTYVDFPVPVFNLSFLATGDNNVGVTALVNVFVNDAFSGTVDVVTDADFNHPDLVDVSGFSNITRIEIVNITNGGGLAFDDFTFDVAASSTFNNGSNINPTGFWSVTAPVVGADWISSIALPSKQDRSMLIMGQPGQQVANVLTDGLFVGELLCSPPYQIDFAAGTHIASIPNNMNLAGLSLRAQGATITTDGVIIFNNALDITIGTTGKIALVK